MKDKNLRLEYCCFRLWQPTRKKKCPVHGPAKMLDHKTGTPLEEEE